MLKRVALCFLLVTTCVSTAFAASDFPFPADWQNWVQLKGPYKFPCDKLAELPKVLQNVGTIYCPLFTADSMVTIYARPEAKAALDSHAAEYPDGANFIFAVSAVEGLGDILLVKGHDLGTPVYGAFKVDGTDIEGAAKAVSKNTCKSCHDVYCQPHGVCNDQDWNK